MLRSEVLKFSSWTHVREETWKLITSSALNNVCALQAELLRCQSCGSGWGSEQLLTGCVHWIWVCACVCVHGCLPGPSQSTQALRRWGRWRLVSGWQRSGQWSSCPVSSTRSHAYPRGCGGCHRGTPVTRHKKCLVTHEVTEGAICAYTHTL